MTNGQWDLEELGVVLELPEICILPMEAWGPGTNGRARSTLGARPLRPTSGGQGYSVQWVRTGGMRATPHKGGNTVELPPFP